MDRPFHPVKDLIVLFGVLGLPLISGTLGAMMFLGVLSPDDIILSISAVAAITVFLLAVVLAHVYHRVP